MKKDYLPILQIGNVLLSPDIITEYFCCDYEKCCGICCVEGDAGAPISFDEIDEIEQSLDSVWHDLAAQAQAVIDRQGIAYADQDGDMVTSIVGGKDCVFTCYTNGFGEKSEEKDERGNSKSSKRSHLYCLCALEKAHREGRIKFKKPISCALYPIREKLFSNGLIGLNYHRWDICKDAIKKGKEESLRVFQFLKEPLITRFGEEWYAELCKMAEEINKE